jgi:hypothetical protein
MGTVSEKGESVIPSEATRRPKALGRRARNLALVQKEGKRRFRALPYSLFPIPCSLFPVP